MKRILSVIALFTALAMMQGCGPVQDTNNQNPETGLNIIIDRNSTDDMTAAQIKAIVSSVIGPEDYTAVYVNNQRSSLHLILNRHNVYSTEFALIRTQNGRVVSFEESDFYPQSVGSSGFYPSCPDSSKETYWTTECSTINTAVSVINDNDSAAKSRGYQSLKAVGSGESKTNVLNYLSCANMRLWGRVGHGYTGGLQLAGGAMLSDFSGVSLSGKGVYANSCQAFNNPFNSKVKGAGANWFISGISDLSIGPSEATFRCWWGKAKDQADICTSLNSCVQSGAGQHGCYGNGQKVPAPGSGPGPNPTPTPDPGPNPTPVPDNSCEGRCGQKAPGGCWCDDLCSQYGDCCSDYQQACVNPTPNPTPTPTPDPTPTPGPNPTPTPDPNPSGTTCSLNPYSSVDWSSWQQYKANFHTHTNRSDGSYDPGRVIDYYSSKGYKILAITDHDTITWPWTDFGKNPASLGMIAVKGDEYSGSEHYNAFWSFSTSSSNLQSGIPHVQQSGGLGQINHPGRDHSSSEANWFIPWYRDYSSTVQLEVFNQGDRYTNDRKLWDNINDSYFKSNKKLVWGASNDDMHSTSHLYRNFQFMLMPQLTEAAVKTAQKTGTFYFCYEPGGSGSANVPKISNITVDNSAKTISVTATGANSISWIGPGTTSVGSGATFNFANYTKSFVRIVLDGSSGDCYSQPFGFDVGSNPNPTPTPDPGPNPTPTPAPDGSSCVGRCGSQAPDGCWCDDMCSQYGDCCSDYQQACVNPTPNPTPAPGKSCEGSCGGQSPDGCYCDSMCSQYGDCCPDYEQVCGSDPGPNPTPNPNPDNQECLKCHPNAHEQNKDCKSCHPNPH